MPNRRFMFINCFAGAQLNIGYFWIVENSHMFNYYIHLQIICVHLTNQNRMHQSVWLISDITNLVVFALHVKPLRERHTGDWYQHWSIFGLITRPNGCSRLILSRSVEALCCVQTKKSSLAMCKSDQINANVHWNQFNTVKCCVLVYWFLAFKFNGFSYSWNRERWI